MDERLKMQEVQPLMIVTECMQTCHVHIWFGCFSTCTFPSWSIVYG